MRREKRGVGMEGGRRGRKGVGVWEWKRGREGGRGRGEERNRCVH